MNIQALPALVTELGFMKCVQAVQTLFDTDLIDETEARTVLKRLRVMYMQQFNDASVFASCNNEAGACYQFNYSHRLTAFKFKLR